MSDFWSFSVIMLYRIVLLILLLLYLACRGVHILLYLDCRVVHVLIIKSFLYNKFYNNHLQLRANCRIFF
jgi:hypothetical protein